jgi:hypothetical protein
MTSVTGMAFRLCVDVGFSLLWYCVTFCIVSDWYARYRLDKFKEGWWFTVSWKGCGRELSRLLRGIRGNPWVNLRDERTLRQTSGKSALTPRFESDTSRVQVSHCQGFVTSDRNSLLRAGRPVNHGSISDMGIRFSCSAPPLGRLWGFSFLVFSRYWRGCLFP